MRRCKSCGVDISERGPNARRCATCQRSYRNRQQRKKYAVDRVARAAQNERNRANHRRRSAEPGYNAGRAAAIRERRRTDPDFAEGERAAERRRMKTPKYRAMKAAQQRRRRRRRRAEREHARRPGHCSLELVDFCWCWEHHRRPRNRPSAPESPLQALRDWLHPTQ